MATRADIAHLLRRATFGPTAQEVDDADRVGLDYTVANLVRPTSADAAATRTPMPVIGPDPLLMVLRQGGDGTARAAAGKTREAQQVQITEWWIDRMGQAQHQFVEKLVFFWHGHWATSMEKVELPQLMLNQQRVFRDRGPGEFSLFVRSMLRDVALIYWLDGQLNTRRAPNENLARELMELFTLGIGHYTEKDVKQGARALTGWQVDRLSATSSLNPTRHDTKNKTILGRTGNFGADEYVDILMQQPAMAEFVVKRLWFRFVSPEPVPQDSLAALANGFRKDRDVTSLARALFTDPNFFWARGQVVKQPIEWLVGALRQLGLRFSELKEDDRRVFRQGLDGMGQVPFLPPSVGGWPSDSAWLTTSATTTRLRLADVLGQRAPKTFTDRLSAVSPAQRPDVLARLLVVDGFTDRTKSAMKAFLDDLPKLVALGLASPEYTVC
jgi:uncharacterized protein (DUF1800 family)